MGKLKASPHVLMDYCEICNGITVHEGVDCLNHCEHGFPEDF